jgi:hypothetical protein
MLSRDFGCVRVFLGLVFGLFLVAGCGFSVLVVSVYLMDSRVNHRYLPSSCVVLDKKLATEMRATVVVRGEDTFTELRPWFHPQIKIQYEVGGKKFEVWTCASTARSSTDRAEQQAILNGFLVGVTHPCWYDPDRPERAVLVRGHGQGFYAAPMVPIVLLVFGGFGLRHLWNRSTSLRQMPSPL